MDKPSFTDKEWKDFYLSDFFEFEKGNQNNMASLANGTLPLVSAKKTDNGYKGFVSRQQRKIFRGGHFNFKQRWRWWCRYRLLSTIIDGFR